MVFKCKICGGTLEIGSNETVATCTYCGMQQTLPKLDDSRRANLYDRANHFRRNNEFDKAMGIYEQILNEDHTDAEAYWSLVLCRYGIEYVEDPSSHKRIPTVNRTQFTSVFDDDNYKSALQYADGLQRHIYEEEAKAINEIQKGILAISQKEEPFDVFICYKETDANGRRTPDSVLANDLYHQLVQEGFKVFFARITLEDKLGSAYEPYIFAALNSARAMVVLGTRPEFFNAAWVKNEWSRYLALIRQGQKKVLIPAYKDMDPYDLPEEFSHLQAQDMSKLGFMQDLIRGIKKITRADEPKETVVKETVVTGGASSAPLLKRAFIFLEDGDWSQADEYCERVLDMDPECARAYLGKLMAELHVRKQADLKDQAEPFDHHNNYRKAVRFADDEFKNDLTDCIEFINTRNEHTRLNDIYGRAERAMDVGNTEKSRQKAIKSFEEAAGLFESVSGWKDADEKACVCRKNIEEINAKIEKERLERERREEIERKKREEERLERKRKEEIERKEAERRNRRNRRIAILSVIGVCAIVVLIYVVAVPNRQYNDAAAMLAEGDYVGAYEAFISLGGYRGADEKAAAIYDQYKIEKLKQTEIGDYVFFGAYEQDNDSSNGKEDIEWLALEKKDGKVLLISKYVLDCQQYHTSREEITWKACTLRKWLNEDFVSAAFSDEERALIAPVTFDEEADANLPSDQTAQDRVFLLSVSEAEKYFHFDGERGCMPTNYAEAQGAYVNKSGETWWWLRSSDGNGGLSACVRSAGEIFKGGSFVDKEDHGVRPAVWVNQDF